AFVKERAGKGGESIDLLQRAIAQKEKELGGPREEFSELYDALASTFEKSGRLKEAIGVLRRVLAARPRDEGLLYSLGAAYEKSGDVESAVTQMKAVLALNPDHADALNFIGYTYAERGVKLEEAERLIVKAHELK